MTRLKKIKNNNLFILTVFIIYILVLILNIYTPLIADDYYRFLIFGEEKKITSFIDLYISVKNSYFNFMGRILPDIISRSFILINNKIIFNMVNSFMFIIFIMSIIKVAIGKEKITLYLFIFSTTIFWIFAPEFGQNCLWSDGSVVYMWSCTFLLIFMIPYRLDFEDAFLYKNNTIFKKIFFVYAFLCGLCHEVYSLLAIVFSCIYFFTKIKNRLHIDKSFYYGFLGIVMGYSILFLSPGNKIRMNSHPLNENVSFFEKISHRFDAIRWVLENYFGSMLIISSILIFVILLKKFIYKKKISYILYISILICIFTACLFLLFPSVPIRTYLIFFVFNLVIIIYCCNFIFSIMPSRFNYFLIFINVLLCIYSISIYKNVYMELKRIYEISVYREYVIKDQIKKSIYEIDNLPKIITDNRYMPMYELDDISNDPNNWVNKAVAIYYNAKTVRTEE